MRLQPGLTVIAPADAAQTYAAIEATYNLPGPIYYRLGKNDKAVVPGLDGRYEFGKVQIVHEGNDLLFLGLGAIGSEVASAAEALAALKIHCTVGLVSTLNPPPTEALLELLSRFRHVITVEVHYITGGLGSLVAEVIADHGLNCRLTRCGVQRISDGLSGSQNYLEAVHGLSSQNLIDVARQIFETKTQEHL
jgi:transketolase